MSNIQKTLDSLQPYVIGIRYLEGTALVDVVFKEGWSVQEQSNLKVVKGDEGMNYYMIFSETKGVGLDDLLDYVGKTIKLNLDREKKHDLLRVKVNELKEVFKKNSLTKLTRLKFTFEDEDLTPKIDEFDMEIEEIEPELMVEPAKIDETFKIQEPSIENVAYVDEDGKAIEMTEEDRELIAEEARAERNRQILESKKQNSSVKKISSNVELPPKRKIEPVVNTRQYTPECNCGEDEACDKCIDNKY